MDAGAHSDAERRVIYIGTFKSIYYQGRTFHTLKGRGFKSNYYDAETGEEYWISGPAERRCGQPLWRA